ncbi:MAG: S41 family peptidase [Gammaproteobacteria bacterium]|nr:MAG: S41 family peptidase [Gammaproteobacteria bacterium]
MYDKFLNNKNHASDHPGVRLLLVFTSALFCSTLAWSESQTEELSTEDVIEAPAEAVPYREIRTFTDVFARIKQDYVEPVEDKTLLESAVRGMLAGLDPHSTYLDREEYQDLQIGTSGEFGGLGIEVGLEDDFVKVIAPIDDTPAQRAGIQAGDVIIRIDDQSVKGLSLDDAVKLMRGKPGTTIELTIIREGNDKPLKFTIERAIIQVKSVKSRTLEPGFIYVRITQFQSHTAELLREAVEDLKDENKHILKGLILDLRNNPGGVLNGAVSVSDAFLNDGLIVYTKGRSDDSAQNYHAKPGDVIDGAPMIVLMNAGSASASEIVSGALQDHSRAIIVGQQSFGKGSVQTILPMHNGDAIKLTTARYYTPSGRSIQAEGITPDIELQPLKLSKKSQEEFSSIKESQLSGHLTNGDSDSDKVKPRSVKKDKKSLAEEDYALFEALNLLKGLVIVKKRAES